MWRSMSGRAVFYALISSTPKRSGQQHSNHGRNTSLMTRTTARVMVGLLPSHHRHSELIGLPQSKHRTAKSYGRSFIHSPYYRFLTLRQTSSNLSHHNSSAQSSLFSLASSSWLRLPSPERPPKVLRGSPRKMRRTASSSSNRGFAIRR